MIYLFSQIAISLVLAAIAGGAAGWLVHRTRSAKQINQLQQVVARQQQNVKEAQSEVSILTADFDDLKQRNDAEISNLTQQNQQIPALNQNLEKSQLLVRQLMEQHKTELDDAHIDTEKLLLKSKLADDREKEITKLQAELDIERRKSTRIDSSNSNSNDIVPDTTNIAALSQVSSTNFDSGTDSDKQTNPGIKTDSNSSSLAATNSASSKVGAVKLPLSGNSISTETIGTETANTNTNTNTPDTNPASNNADTAIESVDSNDETLPNAAQTTAELNALRDQLAEDVPTSTNLFTDKSNFVEVSASTSFTQAHAMRDTTVDDSNLEQLFDTVDQQDDLKQIFGIGPVTEKTLNKLGITAYSQLAELKQHDIEKIADALQIFPGRIERDNWVGGARLQLEEVLEDL